MDSISRRVSCFLASAVVLALAACGGGASSQNQNQNQNQNQQPACGSTGRLGQSKCSAKTCNAGQYCDDTGFPTCTPGCTSDDNCSENEYCKRSSGAAIGVCTRCGDTSSTDNNDAHGKECKRDSFSDRHCGGDQPDAYNCPNDKEPADSDSCAHLTSPSWVWCCP